MEDLSGEEHTSYDARGRIAYTIKRLPDLQFLYATNAGLAQPLVSYRTGFGYDSLDRMTTLIYPDNDAISYTYNNRNLLQSIQGGVNGLTRAGAVIENIAYQSSAQLGSITYGNGILTKYGYDPRLRLASITTAPETNAASPLIAFAYAFDDAWNIKTIYDNRPTSVVPAGNPRRNTQVFAYDDLYRITYAGYAFGTPGDTTINGGSINYIYDRIGNMLGQISAISDSDPITGLPVANLGQMVSGGTAGTANRVGRNAGDPPGPHALTTITPASGSPPRVYPYDLNGNMTDIDGLTNTWDFKDRLIAVENSQMRAQYLYDYTARRVSKSVVYNPGSTNANSPITTLYINKYFEVREYDQPTKYVWNANRRVARVIGSLSAGQRIQRIRLWPGMNLISTAVNGAALPASTNMIAAAYQWNQGTLSWQTVPAGATLSAGSVLWLQAVANGVLTLMGSYADPSGYTVTSGPSFLPSTGLEALRLSTLPAQLTTNNWFYDAQNLTWQISEAIAGTNFNANAPPPVLSPGAALISRSDSGGEYTPPDATLRIRYYHHDHLGSSSVITDSDGNLVEEEALYPFGSLRNVFEPRCVNENYKFTHKERDQESGLQYFEARFHAGNLARFTRIDPLGASLRSTWFLKPQEMNLYAYCGSSPLNLTDPSGMQDGGEPPVSPIPTANNNLPYAQACQVLPDQGYYDNGLNTGDYLHCAQNNSPVVTSGAVSVSTQSAVGQAPMASKAMAAAGAPSQNNPAQAGNGIKLTPSKYVQNANGTLTSSGLNLDKEQSGIGTLPTSPAPVTSVPQSAPSAWDSMIAEGKAAGKAVIDTLETAATKLSKLFFTPPPAPDLEEAPAAQQQAPAETKQ